MNRNNHCLINIKSYTLKHNDHIFNNFQSTFSNNFQLFQCSPSIQKFLQIKTC